MAIITISRELAALGDETANELSKLLDYRFVDKHALEERIKSYGFSERKLEKYDERKPSFWASLSQDRDDYLHYLKTAMLAEAGQGNCVFIGRGANVVFKGVPGVLSIFLVAPDEIRVERVKSYFHSDDKRARQIVEQSDHDRDGFHRYFFDMEWKNPDYYHLTINTGHLHPALCAELIQGLKDRLITNDVESLCKVRIQEMTLAQQLVHHILYEKEIPIHFLEAAVSGGTVTLFGVANSQSLVEAAVSSAREVPSVTAVQSEIQVVQEYSVMP
ncbi:cytidylate kinase family protein [Breznakiella homolactica]|uniref:Cytidylate kinase family protein n=1 Tax=Breznakiella homolactica TaxID=2798577 RepID=A0A7T7XQL0_9SPIR|nr:cytidylate kinase family protein [Breznakiella homolactica]QQO10679.1 cytidylate kinase family protein [Breznakiella homolactica]